MGAETQFMTISLAVVAVMVAFSLLALIMFIKGNAVFLQVVDSRFFIICFRIMILALGFSVMAYILAVLTQFHFKISI